MMEREFFEALEMLSDEEQEQFMIDVFLKDLVGFFLYSERNPTVDGPMWSIFGDH